MTRRLDEAVARTRALVSTRALTGLTHQDADADIGTIGSDDAVNFDPRPLLAALQQSGVHIVVIGQVAGILHGSRELTGDLDLLWTGDPSDADALAGVFRAAGADLADDEGGQLPCIGEAFLLPKVVFTTPTPAETAAHQPCRGASSRSTTSSPEASGSLRPTRSTSK